MKNHMPFFCRLYAAFCLCCAAPILHAQTTIVKVYDGDTFVTSTGETIRLVGINAPESCGSKRGCEPFGDEAKTYTQQWLQGQTVRLEGDKLDRFNRRLANAYLADGTWVNKALVAQGYAHTYTFPDNPNTAQFLLNAEAKARKNKLGLWAEPRWQPRLAELCCQKSDIGKFILVEGKIQDITTVKNTTYLNFGEDWRTDFTAALNETAHHRFLEKNIVPYQLRGKTVRVRGVAKPVNGTLITITHPAQIERLD